MDGNVTFCDTTLAPFTYKCLSSWVDIQDTHFAIFLCEMWTHSELLGTSLAERVVGYKSEFPAPIFTVVFARQEVPGIKRVNVLTKMEQPKGMLHPGKTTSLQNVG